jgi:hypothetical protein
MLDKEDIIFRILGEANVQTNFGDQLPSHSMGMGGSFTRGKSAGPWSYHSPPLIAEFKREWIYIHFFICLHKKFASKEKNAF